MSDRRVGTEKMPPPESESGARRSSPDPTTVFTVGHGARSLEELTGILVGAGVKVIVDVRRFPGSRRHPHFAGAALAEALRQSGIAYEWWGEELGGRRSARGSTRHPAWRVAGFRDYADHMDTQGFGDALDRLEKELRSGAPAALMCAETLWWRCHRRLISDALTVHGFDVVHLLDRDTRQSHPLHDRMRIDEQNRPVYDVGFTEPMEL